MLYAADSEGRPIEAKLRDDGSRPVGFCKKCRKSLIPRIGEIYRPH